MFVNKRVQTSVRLAVGLALAVLLVAVAQVHIAHAAGTANTLKVSPVRSDIEVKPGSVKVVPTTVTNLTKDAITVRPIENDFVSGDQSGTPAIILDSDGYAPSHSLKRFMTPIADVTIPGGQSKTINVIITVPNNAQAGGYFGAIRFAPTAGDSGGQVNLSASVASLILLTVPGDIIEKIDMTGFDVEQDNTPGTSFPNGNGLQATVRFQNKGNVQIGPFGKVSVKKGDKVIYETDFNNKDQRDMILPDSLRLWNIPLQNVDGFGQYTVIATFTYGAKNQTIEVTKSFWIIPPSVVIGAIVAIFVLIGLVIATIFFIRARRSKRPSFNRARHGRRR